VFKDEIMFPRYCPKADFDIIILFFSNLSVIVIICTMFTLFIGHIYGICRESVKLFPICYSISKI